MKVIRVQGDGAKKLDSALKSIKGFVAKVGWVAKKKYENSEMTTAAAAAIAETGYPAKNIPQRAHGRPTIERRKKVWAKIAESEAKKIFDGKQTGKGAMEVLGLQAAGDWRETITQIFDPPLSPRTIAARLRKKKDRKTVGNLTKPLIDTTQMIESLTNAVEKE